MLTYQFRLYPNQEQIQELFRQLGCHRWLYNQMLACQKAHWELDRFDYNFFKQSKLLTKMRHQGEPRVTTINRSSASQTLARLKKAYENFYRRCKQGYNKDEGPGYPKFKGRNRFDSITFVNKNGARLKDGRLYIQYMPGTIKIRLHRPIEGNIKIFTVKKKADHWYLNIVTDHVVKEILPTTGIDVGIDLGITHLVATSDGQFFPNPKHLNHSQKKLRRLQRHISRCKKGSNRRKKAVLQLQRLHMKITNQRSDTVCKIACQLTDQYDNIFMEDLQVKNMAKNSKLSKSIADASWNTLTNRLEVKALATGRTALKVDPKNTSQICSGCGEIVKKDLSVRTHKCDCGLTLDRDVNAALNIKGRGYRLQGVT